MFNYNVINPVNIHYRKYPQKEEGNNVVSEENKKQIPTSTDDSSGGQKRFPNGNKVAIDYTKNQINISQVFQDFRSTIAAINTPDDIKEEVEAYLNFSSKETLKDNPSREIVLANLKNAARLTDRYIEESLKKPSRVVQDWVDALFLQKINLKADPTEINEDFRVKIPPKKEATPIAVNSNNNGLTPLDKDTVSFTGSKSEVETESVQEEVQYTVNKNFIESSYGETETLPEADFVSIGSIGTNTVVESTIEPEEAIQTEEIKENAAKEEGLYAARSQNEVIAKEIAMEAKLAFEEGKSTYETLKLYDRALELLEGSDNINLKSAIYFERAKVFDSGDYVELALIDYNKATKASDNNLKTHAHLKMGNIYDDYVQIDPAMYQYSKAIETSEEINNLQGKTRALRYMASMFAGIYDSKNTEAFSDLALESAKETRSKKTIAKTYLEVANNYKYIGEDSKALQIYSTLAQDEDVQDDFETLAQNYMEASALMDKKGNKKKSYALLLKSKEYQRLAKLRRSDNA